MNEQPYVDYAAAAAAMWGTEPWMIVTTVWLRKKLYPEEWV
jgi:hypothetical protein